MATIQMDDDRALGKDLLHSIVSRAALVGMERAVKEMIEAIRG